MSNKYILIIISLVIGYIFAQYDPCGYVGSSNNPNLPDICLSTSQDCCYLSWNYTTYVFYSCVNKNKVITRLSKTKNISMEFTQDLGDTLQPVRRYLYSKCNDPGKFITSPAKAIPPSPISYRLLYSYESDKSYFRIIFDYITTFLY